ncbi:hypothetical protein D3C84_908720 [compost metagenome]
MAHFIEQGGQLLAAGGGGLANPLGFVEVLLGVVQGLPAHLGAVPLGQPQGDHRQQIAGVLVEHGVARAQFEYRQGGTAAIQADQPEDESQLQQGPEGRAAPAQQQVGETDHHQWPEDMRGVQAAEVVDEDHGVAADQRQGQVGHALDWQPGIAQDQQAQRHADDQQEGAL